MNKFDKKIKISHKIFDYPKNIMITRLFIPFFLKKKKRDGKNFSEKTFLIKKDTTFKNTVNRPNWTLDVKMTCQVE